MAARIAAEIRGPSLEAVTRASLALADELATQLAGSPARVVSGTGDTLLCVIDEISGPFDFNDGSNLPLHIVDFTAIVMPAQS